VSRTHISLQMPGQYCDTCSFFNLDEAKVDTVVATKTYRKARDETTRTLRRLQEAPCLEDAKQLERLIDAERRMYDARSAYIRC